MATLCAPNAAAGYTHYWRWRKTPEPAALAPCIEDMGRIADASRDILADDQDREKDAAVFGGKIAFLDGGPLLPGIAFNGIGDDAYEPFAFPLVDPGTPAFQAVKTEWKPYDEVVVACLIAARDHFPPDVLTIESDGDWSPDWSRGAQLYERVLGRTAHNPLDARGALLSDEAPIAPSSNEGGFRKNLLLSLIVFLALALAYTLVRKRA